jgi:flagellar M-ring protein FliF
MDNAVATTPTATLVPERPSFSERLSRVPLRPLLSLGAGVAALAAIGIALVMHASKPDFRVLYAGVSDRDSGAVLAQLTAMNVPYRLGEGSGTVMVPADRVHEVRMKLSAAGLPKGSVEGYELLDKQRFGQTQAGENVSIKRALEGELMRTIGSLGVVESAKVMLALPAQSGFFREQQKPSASVVVHLRPGRSLDRAQLSGIVHLVSASVPDMNPRAVKVTDGTGALLTTPETEGSGGLDPQQLQYVHQLESSLQRRLMELIEPVVGRENLRATVTADIDFSETMSVTEEYKPNQGEAPAAVRNQQTLESNQGGASPPSGVPGAQSNQAPTPATAPATGSAAPLQGAQAGANTSGRRELNTSYEIDKTQRTTRAATGTVKRLSAAVVLNHKTATDARGKTTSTPWTQEELDKLTALVQQGIGFSKDRGDTVQVVNTSFRTEPVPKAVETPVWQQPWVMDNVRSLGAPVALALLALLIVFTMIKPSMRMLAPAQPVLPAGGSQLQAVVDDPLPDGTGQDNVLAVEGPKQNAKITAARQLARQNPAAVAHVVRTLMAQGAAPAAD